jgi:hypothetical protein
MQPYTQGFAVCGGDADNHVARTAFLRNDTDLGMATAPGR